MFFLTAILAKSLILVGVVVFTVIAHQLLLHGGLHPHFFTHPEFYIITAFVLLLVAIIQAVSQIVRITGGRVLINFILGNTAVRLTERCWL